MGNQSSFCSTRISAASKASKVIFPGGEVRQFRHPVKAAELMLESPNSFLANTKSLNVGRRFAALSADEDLEFGNIYIIFPMKRLKSVVTSDDTDVLFMVANPTARASANKVKVLPESAATALPESEAGGSKTGFEEVEGLDTSEFKYRLSVSRSRKPVLDTITEEQSRHSKCFPRGVKQSCVNIGPSSTT
ncbi:hypothetical protein DCAR_0935078 [Daucus carota subsp. sativus]|uniref:DUF4228 domain-containing protein n=1 Tax=Daucus carota subsp. sativus TaxID=79200 RepID=A0A175YIG2_DAUCS|nr:PREDICTED: uncharacterized protein LOC108200169 [Daucus carota subsp. sativus]WOH15536.1 hypothetical protein DCAR_0935078 [Daucus carota subsp. sativus]